jgi:hypothetical protein
MTVTRNENGSLTLSMMWPGERVKETLYGYTVKALFIKERRNKC